MKSIFLTAMFFFSCFVAINDVTAGIKLFGIEISYERGHKEWNADRTEVYCIGRGICSFSIKGNAGSAIQPGDLGSGTLGFYENGRFGMSFPSSLQNNSYWAETFANGSLYIDKDIEIDNSIRSQIQNCPNVIKAGVYRYQVEGDKCFVTF